MKILAIDDNPDNLVTLKATMTYVLPESTVITCRSGVEGIGLAREVDPDVILLDIIMPGMDGFTVCRQLKADTLLRDIPVIFLTAIRTDQRSRIMALEAGAEAFLSKPPDELELTAQIRAMVKIKAANRSRRQENERLAELVAIRTRELQQELAEHKRTEEERRRLQAQLQQAQKMESIGRLAGGVAHDFNNMLSVILGFSELALQKIEAGSPLCDDLQEIREAARRSAEITRQLLAFARKQAIRPRLLDLNETVESMLKMLGRLIGEDIDLCWKPAAKLWQVRIDPSQIDQLLANLCVNARDAIDGTGRLTIETGRLSLDSAREVGQARMAAGEYVTLTVSDTGCGMEPELRDLIFEPFFTTKEQGKGTGLGLATVYGIVKQNDGFIEVDSRPGRGTTFTIFLPRHLENTAGVPAEDCRIMAHGGNGETILVVEDEPPIIKLIGRILSDHGYQVLTALTPAEAVEHARRQTQIHLLLTDVVMPEMNGFELAEQLRALHPRLRCLFMSGYTARAMVSQQSPAQEDNFIQKPFSAQELAVRLRQVLTAPPGNQQP